MPAPNTSGAILESSASGMSPTSSLRVPKSNSDLRTKDADEIYKAISNENDPSGAPIHSHLKKETPSHRDDNSTINDEEDRIVGNPWNPLSWYRQDKQEQRYLSSSDEGRPNAPEDAQNQKQEDPQPFVDPESQISPGELGSRYPVSERNQESQLEFRSERPTQASVNPRGRQKFTRANSVAVLKRLWPSGKHTRKPETSNKDEEDEDDVMGDLTLTRERTENVITQLTTGSPVVFLLASCFVKDDHGFGRVPLLLSLLGFVVTDELKNDNVRNRLFRIDLEYGVGRERMRWSVKKTAKDLWYLHSRLKIAYWKSEAKLRNIDKPERESLPKYPFPPRILRNKRKEIITTSFGSSQVNEDASSINTSHSLRSRVRLHFSPISLAEDPHNASHRAKRNQQYVIQVLNYLKALTSSDAAALFSLKIFQFFELLPISSLLSYERNFVGRQGPIHIGGTAKKQGWRVGHFRANDVKGMIDRRLEKWLLVRGSYIMYVTDVNLTVPLEVFLIDPKFTIKYNGSHNLGIAGKIKDEEELDNEEDEDIANLETSKPEEESLQPSKAVINHWKITLENNERQLVLKPKLGKEQRLWLKCLEAMKTQSLYSQQNRFGSFAPVRKNCFAQWIVDGRDHFWAISSALEMATDTIFIHDWWLSPELYLRRPANSNQQWRLDRVLQRKAKQGVKIFVIVYRNVGTTVATDSLYTKHLILLLDEENIHVIRLPNQLLQNTYFWAHHEKLCIVDYKVAFLGGIDLCYGRFDTADHVLTDDSKNVFEPLSQGTPQTFPGKDYLNPRVKDFFNLDKPYEDMYDRETVPRMPWHDVHMVTGGQIAVDLARHFVQRWNYLLRQKRPLRPTPLLTPPPEMSHEEAQELGLDGTCEVQLLRLLGPWLLGLKEHEQSIQNAYLKLIETLEHFVYIENQFFITLCVIDGIEIKNRIGDALVDRIIRAHKEGKPWRAIIVIPLMPGFESQVDEPDGLSVRVIMQCQYMSILRGATLIFAKLIKYGIEPDDYIQFFSLRKWDAIGSNRTLVTEQLYIHAKTMIADDRAAIIGSANINERSMRGVRDLEVAAVIRDSETIHTTMNGKSYLAGKFPHTLRMRLMREHLGVDVDLVDVVERRFRNIERFARSKEGLKYAAREFEDKEQTIKSAMIELAKLDVLEGGAPLKSSTEFNMEEDDNNYVAPLALPISFNNRTGPHEANKGIRDKKKHSYDPRVQQNAAHKNDVDGNNGYDNYKGKGFAKSKLNAAKALQEMSKKFMVENPGKIFLPHRHEVEDYLKQDENQESEEALIEFNKQRWMILKRVAYLQRSAAVQQEEREAESKRREKAGMKPFPELKSNLNGPLTQVNVSDNTPDSNGSSDPATASTEKEDIPIVLLEEHEVQDLLELINPKEADNFNMFIDPYGFEDPLDACFYEDLWFEHARRNTELYRMVFHCQPDDLVATWKDYKKYLQLQKAFSLAQRQEAKYRRRAVSIATGDSSDSISVGSESPQNVKGSNLEDEVNGLLGLTPEGYQKVVDEEQEKKSQKKRNKFKRKKNDGRNGKPNQMNGDDEDDEEENDNEEVEEEEENYQDAYGDQEDEEGNLGSGFDGIANGDDSPGSKFRSTDMKEETPSSEFDEKNGESNYSRLRGTSRRRRKKFGTFSGRRRMLSGDRVYDRETSERLLNEIVGHLVFFPADWLMTMLEGGNWFFNADRIPPIEIYD